MIIILLPILQIHHIHTNIEYFCKENFSLADNTYTFFYDFGSGEAMIQ